jgi:Rho guanine nucleotide exchange factor 12
VNYLSGQRRREQDLNFPPNLDFKPIREIMSNLFISEFFHTERSHVRKLKVLDRLFYRPLLEEGSHMPRDLVERLFPNLEEVLAWHDKYNRRMKDRIKNEGVPIGNVADILSDMVRCFSGTHLW